jgi:GntR family transcriptional regulator
MAASPRRERAKYVQLADTFRRIIAQQDWPVGSQLPTVEDLAAKHAVARITVRQAMDILAREGLLSRSRGRGTHVLRLPAVSRWHRLTAEWSEFMHLAEDSVSTLLADQPDATLPDLPADAGSPKGKYRYLRVLGSRKAGPPIAIRSTYLREAVYRRIKADIPNALLLDLLGRHAVRVTIRTEISAADPDTARLLQVPFGTPVLEGRHVGVDEHGVVVFVEHAVLRGDYIKFEIVLSKGPTDP